MKTNPASRASLTRRSFLKQSLVASGGLAFPMIVPGRVLGRDGGVAPSNRIVMGGLGIGRRGGGDLAVLLHEPDVQFIAIADVRAERRQAVKEMADQQNGTKDCKMYRDFRELHARPDIDALLIATGDRWH